MSPIPPINRPSKKAISLAVGLQASPRPSRPSRPFRPNSNYILHSTFNFQLLYALDSRLSSLDSRLSTTKRSQLQILSALDPSLSKCPSCPFRPLTARQKKPSASPSGCRPLRGRQDHLAHFAQILITFCIQPSTFNYYTHSTLVSRLSTFKMLVNTKICLIEKIYVILLTDR